MGSAQITGCAPVLLVRDVVKSAAYFGDKLGFTEQSRYGEPTNFAIISRNGFRLMLAQLDEEKASQPYWQIVGKMWNAYFWVDDAEALYEEFGRSGAIIDYALHTKPYGVKEFGVQDLDGHDIAFGQVVRS